MFLPAQDTLLFLSSDLNFAGYLFVSLYTYVNINWALLACTWSETKWNVWQH